MKSLRIIVAGSRGFTDHTFIYRKLDHLTRNLDEVVVLSGLCENSADMISIDWAEERGWLWESYPAKWEEVDVPGAVVRYRSNGVPYNVLAGHWRNEVMAGKAGAAVIFIKNDSRGSLDMLSRAEAHGLLVRHFIV